MRINCLRLIELRKKLGMSIPEFSTLTGISEEKLHNLTYSTSMTVEYSELCKLAKRLDVKPGYLTNFEYVGLTKLSTDIVDSYDIGFTVNRIKRLCKLSGKTLGDVLEELNLSYSMLKVSQNRGIPSVYLMKFAIYFNTSIDYLMGLTSDPSSINEILMNNKN